MADSAVLVSADGVFAYYLEGAKTLQVIAVGVAYGGTQNIRIERLPFAGGLKFAVKGDLEHVAGFQPYSVSHVEKNIEIPSVVLPSKSIVVEDSENPLGRVIAIKFFGLG